MKSEANEMQTVPPRSLKLGMHTVRHRQEEGGEERNSKAMFTSPLCMQSSSGWHLPKCKGVFPSPSLWFGSAPWSRSSCTGKKETEPHQSLPFAPQVRPTWAAGPRGSHQAALGMLLFSSSSSSQNQGMEVCAAMQKDPAQSQAVPLPLGFLRGRTGTKNTLLHQYSPRARSHCSPFSRGTWQILEPEFSWQLCHRTQKTAISVMC